ncbi:hypothetical protein FRC12_003793, partial [Ceratobasidium sp. 428]
AKLISPFGLLGRCSSRNFRRRLREHYYEPAAQFTGESRDEDTIRITSFLRDFVIDFGPAESKESDSSQPINHTIDDIEKDEDNKQSTQIQPLSPISSQSTRPEGNTNIGNTRANLESR